MLGLPPTIRACLFDLDGVLTQTATAHAAAWKEMFDAFLRAQAAETGEAFVPFDPVADYRAYVDGRPRYDGVRSFLAARGIELPEAAPSDSEAVETVRGLGDRKNELVREMIRRIGVTTFEGSVRYVVAARDRKSTRLNSSHVKNSYAAFCLKKKNKHGRADTSGDRKPKAVRLRSGP